MVRNRAGARAIVLPLEGHASFGQTSPHYSVEVGSYVGCVGRWAAVADTRHNKGPGVPLDNVEVPCLGPACQRSVSALAQVLRALRARALEVRSDMSPRCHISSLVASRGCRAAPAPGGCGCRAARFGHQLPWFPRRGSTLAGLAAHRWASLRSAIAVRAGEACAEWFAEAKEIERSQEGRSVDAEGR